MRSIHFPLGKQVVRQLGSVVSGALQKVAKWFTAPVISLLSSVQSQSDFISVFTFS